MLFLQFSVEIVSEYKDSMAAPDFMTDTLTKRDTLPETRCVLLPGVWSMGPASRQIKASFLSH